MRQFGRSARPLDATTNIEQRTLRLFDGLDCAHSGVCYRDEAGVPRLLHASTARNAVVLDEDLATYVASVRTHSGVMVARPIEIP